MNKQEAPEVLSGRLTATRMYDLGYAVDLARVERNLRESATRPGFTRASPRSVSYATPPVDIGLGQTTIELLGSEATLHVRVRVYDFGAARLSYELPLSSLPWGRYVELANQMETVLQASPSWEEYLARVRGLLGDAVQKPQGAGPEVGYLFATVHRLDPPLGGERLMEVVDLVPLLTGDTRPLSAHARKEAMEHAYSYYSDDLVVIGPSRALILEPGGEPDIEDILAVAHAQLLELRYYAHRLDRELPAMYDRIERARSTFGGLARRRYATLARSLHALLAEVTELSERIENALVVTEDVYLAEVYAAALDQYRVHASSAAVDRKLAIIRDAYSALHEEATSARAEYLEIAIVLLIALEILLAFVL